MRTETSSNTIQRCIVTCRARHFYRDGVSVDDVLSPAPFHFHVPRIHFSPGFSETLLEITPCRECVKMIGKAHVWERENLWT